MTIVVYRCTGRTLGVPQIDSAPLVNAPPEMPPLVPLQQVPREQRHAWGAAVSWGISFVGITAHNTRARVLFLFSFSSVGGRRACCALRPAPCAPPAAVAGACGTRKEQRGRGEGAVHTDNDEDTRARKQGATRMTHQPLRCCLSGGRGGGGRGGRGGGGGGGGGRAACGLRAKKREGGGYTGEREQYTPRRECCLDAKIIVRRCLARACAPCL